MTNENYFKLNEPQVTGELLDGEFVMVHFDTGCYYSIRDSAADVCNLLLAGCSTTSAVEQILANYGGDPAEIEQQVSAFVGQLLAEQLFVPAAPSASAAANVKLISSTLTSLVVEKFDDMADQLLLDPIHEIDERGWPQRKSA